MQRRPITIESLNAPGLPYPPNPPLLSNTRPKTKITPLLSINYDYLPMSLESPKNLWVDLMFSPPSDMVVGTLSILHIAPQRGIQNAGGLNLPQSSFEISDIIGSRLVLSPYKGSSWLPTVHSACDTPFGWGYNMNVTNVSPSMHSTKYGYGAPIAYLEYFPSYY